MRGRSQILAAALLLIGGVFVVTFVVTMRMSRGTVENRIRINAELGALRDRLQHNPTDREALTNLILALNDPYRFKRVVAAGCLGQVGTAAKDAVPALAHALKGNEMFLSGAAALALSKLGPDAREAIPELIEATQRGNCTTAWNAAEALGNMQSDAVTVVPALIKCLDGVGNPLPDGGTVGPELAIEASNALAKFGPQAREALIPLKSKLNTSDARLRLTLARAIRLIDPEDTESLETLIILVNNREMNSWALTALGKLGTNAYSAIPAVENYLTQQLTQIERQHAEITLQKLKRLQ